MQATTHWPERSQTLIDTLLFRGRTHTVAADAVLVTLFAGFVALTAQIRIPLSFTPVPITGQTLGILLTGSVIGMRRGALALALYLVWGAIGLPVFAGGVSGTSHFMGSTGGYLLAYPLAAAIVGYLAERGWDRIPSRLAAMLVLGNLSIYVPGVLWLACFVGGIAPAIWLGFVPFIIGDGIKILLALALMPTGWKIVNRIQGAANHS